MSSQLLSTDLSMPSKPQTVSLEKSGNKLGLPSIIEIERAYGNRTDSNAYQDWFQTTRFVVDSYHYINHKATDNICHTWCNPAPTDGSAPNLVIPTTDKHGQPCFKRAFNTQACEQLNSWLGGYESILKRMTPGNFNWFLHTMLYYHTKYVWRKQQLQKEREKRKIQDDASDAEQDAASDYD